MDLTVLTLNLWFDLKLQEARTRALLEARWDITLATNPGSPKKALCAETGIARR